MLFGESAIACATVDAAPYCSLRTKRIRVSLHTSAMIPLTSYQFGQGTHIRIVHILLSFEQAHVWL